MAIDGADILARLNAVRVSSSNCSTPGGIARSLDALQDVISQIFNEYNIEFQNIVNNGGGGATTPVYIIRATVQQLGGVPASQATFAFDGATDLLTSTGQASGVTFGTARNPGRYFQDNEPIKLVSFNGTTWLADKISDNTIGARVNEPGDVLTTDLTFNFDEAVAIGTATIPAGGTGVAINGTGNAFANDELIVLQLVENPQVLINAGLDPNSQAWVVLQDDDDLGGSGGGGVVLEADFGIDGNSLESGVVTIDRRSPTGYLSGEVQLAGKNTNGEFRWFTGIQCNPLSGV